MMQLTLADAIIQENLDAIKMILQKGVALDQVDEYGFTPLIESAIANNTEIAELIIQYGAPVNLKDMTGGTALHWAVENNNIALTRLLLEQGADPNAYNFSGQPILVMPLLRQQKKIKHLLMESGANLSFAQDFINTKLVGHMFELVGTTSVVDPNNQFVEIDFEGFFLEFSIGLISESLIQFKQHFSARSLRPYFQLIQVTIETFYRASRLIQYQQYQVNIEKHKNEIDTLLMQEPLMIPLGYEGHAITLIKCGNMMVKCDRREESRLYDNIVFYQMQQADMASPAFLKKLLYEQQSSDFINAELPEILGWQAMTELKVPAQISGNCSWANVEACLPALFFIFSSSAEDFQENMTHHKNMALKFFTRWREWNKDRALHRCIENFHHSDSIRKASQAEILAAILFQCCQEENNATQNRIESILSVLTLPQYEYILQNYIKSYYYEDMSQEGKDFVTLLRKYGYQKHR